MENIVISGETAVQTSERMIENVIMMRNTHEHTIDRRPDQLIDNVIVLEGVYNPQIEGEFEQEFEKKYFQSKFPWDDFQLHAFKAVRDQHNVLVVAPTSSGKTSVARYAVLRALFANNKKVIYTAPIKSLSNEKYQEMCEMLRPFGVVPGLLTGDQKINVESNMLIMTAEILANSLFNNLNLEELKQKALDRIDMTDNSIERLSSRNQLDSHALDQVGCVIMDEIHFISVEGRGQVWENTLIRLDNRIQIIGLSATIDNPEQFAQWIGSIKEKPTYLVKKYGRSVPLNYNIFDGTKLHTFYSTVEDSKYDDLLLLEAYNNLLTLRQKTQKKSKNFQSFLLNRFVGYAKKEELLQLGFIVFSKKKCEKFCELLEGSFLDAPERAMALRELEKLMGIYLKDYQTLPRYQQIKRLLERGIGFHHAGLQVIFKETIEHLFKEGYIKILFATETIAIGVNMPIRTMVFISLNKSIDCKIVPIDSAEFKQICGRAGRRGLDNKGTIVLLPLYQLPDTIYLKNNQILGGMPKIDSKLQLNPHDYLKMLGSCDGLAPEQFYNRSLFSRQMQLIKNKSLLIKHRKQSQVEQSDECIQKYITDTRFSMETFEHMKRIYIQMNRTNTIGGIAIKRSKKEEQEIREGVRMIQQHPTIYQMIILNQNLLNEIQHIDMEIKKNENYAESELMIIRDFLYETEYVKEDGQITEYGMICQMINECNPFLLTELITSDLLGKISKPEDMIALISIFVEPFAPHDDIIGSDSLKKIEQCIDQMVISGGCYLVERMVGYRILCDRYNMESMRDDKYWTLVRDNMEIAYLWAMIDLDLNDHGDILGLLDEIGCYEGHFVKNMLKINNIVDQIRIVCTILGRFEVVPLLQLVERKLLKGIVKTHSLHIIDSS